MSLGNTVLKKSRLMRWHPGWWCALLATVLGLVAGQAFGQCADDEIFVQQQKLTAADAAGRDFFGSSVSVSEDTTVVGTRPGAAAFVYRFNGTFWVEEQKLTAFDAGAGRFGNSVSVSGDTVVVGARLDDHEAFIDCEVAYVYRFNGIGWVQEQRLTACHTPVGGDRLGPSVSISGDVVVVGAYLDDCATGRSCGSAYVFRFDGTSWVEEQKLTASDASGGENVFEGDQFGRSVSMSGDTAVVGAWGDDCTAGRKCGAAYVFRYNGTAWVEDQKLTASDAAAGDRFGVSVSASGNTAVVGAFHGDCETGNDCGLAYVFSCAVAPTIVNLDIKPGSCPNPVNPRSRGVVPVALVGSLGFDVATVDPDSLTLARADGVGGSVSPLSGRGDPGIVIEDFVTSFGDEPCGCHALGGDGIDDLSLKFSTAEICRALELNVLPRGKTIELVLRGTMLDGTTFEVADCIRIPGRKRESR